MASEMSLFDPPPPREHKRSPSSTRSIRSNASSSSKSSKKAHIRNLFSLKRGEERADSPTLKFSSRGSIASGDSASTTSSNKSAASVASDASKLSSTSSRTTVTENDLFGIKVPPTAEELAPTVPDGVELGGCRYKVPEPIEKEFYRDLTMLEDEELIRKYGLIKVSGPENTSKISKDG